jgi:hypothetical protein
MLSFPVGVAVSATRTLATPQAWLSRSWRDRLRQF